MQPGDASLCLFCEVGLISVENQSAQLFVGRFRAFLLVACPEVGLRATP